jgi:hypothetical protein
MLATASSLSFGQCASSIIWGFSGQILHRCKLLSVQADDPVFESIRLTIT